MKWWKPSQSEDIKPIPWLAPDVVEYLDNIVRPDFEVLEHGSGGSTLWFASRVKHVTAIEKDPDWAMMVKAQAPQNVIVVGGNTTVKIQLCDLVLIDGNPPEDRAQWLRHAIELVKSGGWIVLDNANRPEYEQERAGLSVFADLVKTFDGNEGGTRYLVTDFWKMKGGE